MARIGRRTFLKLTGTSAIATRMGGMAAILASQASAGLRPSRLGSLAPLERFRARIG